MGVWRTEVVRKGYLLEEGKAECEGARKEFCAEVSEVFRGFGRRACVTSRVT